MIFESQNYTIEPVHEKYAWRICDFVVVNSERLKRFFPKTLEQNLTPALSQIFVDQKLRKYQDKQELLFILKEKELRTVIGLIYIKNLDWETKQAELAYCIGYQYENMGYTTQSVIALSKYAFDILRFKTLQIIVHKSNNGSIRVAERCGYLWQRTLEKEFDPSNGSPLDMELYELASEWMS